MLFRSLLNLQRAVIAERGILAAVLIVGVVIVDDAAAPFADGAVPVVAGPAERRNLISGMVLPVGVLVQQMSLQPISESRLPPPWHPAP